MADNHLNSSPEIWKAIPEFPGYEVSNQGRVRSYWSQQSIYGNAGRVVGIKPILSSIPIRILCPSTSKNRLSVTLCRDNKHFYRLVYRLVLEVFVGPCPPGLECRHLDGNPTNNFLGNLCWGTHSENMLDRTRHGTNWNNRGMKCPTAKLTDSQVLEIRHLAHQGITQKKIGEIFDIDQSHVSHIVNFLCWQHLPE